MDLDLLGYATGLRRRGTGGTRGGDGEVWCGVRRGWYLAQPEELVRQALLAHLCERGYPPSLMQVERRVGPSGDRLDLRVFDPQHRPFLIVECKAPGYALQPAVLQLARYNRHWSAPYALAVNGVSAVCLRIDFEGQRADELEALPDYPRGPVVAVSRGS